MTNAYHPYPPNYRSPVPPQKHQNIPELSPQALYHSTDSKIAMLIVERERRARERRPAPASLPPVQNPGHGVWVWRSQKSWTTPPSSFCTKTWGSTILLC